MARDRGQGEERANEAVCRGHGGGGDDRRRRVRRRPQANRDEFVRYPDDVNVRGLRVDNREQHVDDAQHPRIRQRDH